LSTTAQCPSCSPTLSAAKLLPPLDSHKCSAGNTQAGTSSGQVAPLALEQHSTEQSRQRQGGAAGPSSRHMELGVSASPSPPPTRAPKQRRLDALCVVGVQASPARKLLRQLDLPGECLVLSVSLIGDDCAVACLLL
jgi:hypothetical protein